MKKTFNAKVSSDFVLVGRYFEREVCLWAVLGQQFRLCEDKYDEVAKFCRALTNWHIIHNPLSASDEKQYTSSRSVLYAKGVTKVEQKRASLSRYRKNKRKRMNETWVNTFTQEQIFFDDEDEVSG